MNGYFADFLIILGLIALCAGVYLWRRRKAQAGTSAIPAMPASLAPVEARVQAVASTIMTAEQALMRKLSPVAVAPIAAAVPPAAEASTTPPVPAAAVASETAPPSTDDGTPHSQEKSMNEGTGTIPAAPLLDEANRKDLFFLLQVNQMFPGSDNLPYHVLSGSEQDIKDVISYAHATGQEPQLDIHVHDWLTGYSGPLKDAVKPLVQAGINKRTNPFSRRIYQGYFDKYLA